MALLLLLFVGALPPGVARSQIPPGAIGIELEPVASGLAAPVGVTHAGDGSGRLFIVDQTGQIWIVENDVILPTPFLDIADRLPELSQSFDERGLLGLAFHPDYETNGRFFVRYSAPREGDPSEPCFDSSRGCHMEVLAEFQVSAGDPNLADPNSEIILFTVDEPQFNHNAGDLAFGPDGLLYFGLGDGGGANDGLHENPPSHGPIGNGQNIETPLGSILRIDVDTAQPPLPYGIPPDNPFVGVPGVDEIYAYGMRNPYKHSFDDGPGGSGALWVADVGQNLFEELDIVTNGGNYGWVIREGFHCFDPFNPTQPPPDCPDVGPLGEPLLDPVVEYSHDDGGLSVIGGFVYRGDCSESLFGKYVFGDFSAEFSSPSGRLYYLVEPTPGSYEILEFPIGNPPRPYGLFLKGFGEGEDGEIYVCGSQALAPTGTTGVVERLVAEDCGPVPVELSFLAVTRRASAAVIAWKVARASDHAGFHVYREEPSGERTRLTERLLSGRADYEYVDAGAPAEGADYWLVEVSLTGETSWHGPVTLPATAGAPPALALGPVQPNPFTSSTTITYSLPEAMRVRITVYDAQGRRLTTLADAAQAPGRHAVTWDGRVDGGALAPAGIYLARLQVGNEVRTQKFVLTR